MIVAGITPCCNNLKVHINIEHSIECPKCHAELELVTENVLIKEDLYETRIIDLKVRDIRVRELTA